MDCVVFYAATLTAPSESLESSLNIYIIENLVESADSNEIRGQSRARVVHDDG